MLTFLVTYLVTYLYIYKTTSYYSISMCQSIVIYLLFIGIKITIMRSSGRDLLAFVIFISCQRVFRAFQACLCLVGVVSNRRARHAPSSIPNWIRPVTSPAICSLHYRLIFRARTTFGLLIKQSSFSTNHTRFTTRIPMLSVTAHTGRV